MADLDYSIKVDVKKALKGIDDLKKKLNQTTKAVKKTDAQFKTMSGGLGKLKGLVTALAVGGFGLLIKNSLASADALGKAANKIGLTTKELQELRFAAEQSGVAANTLDTSMQRFSRRLGEAAIGTGVLNKVLKEQDISIMNVDGSMRSVNDVFVDYMSSISGATSEQEKLRLAIAAFDMEGGNMVNMLAAGTKGLAAMRKEANGLGLIITKETIDSATMANDAWGRVKAQFSAVAMTVSAELAPAIQDISLKMSKFLADKDAIKQLAEGFKTLGAGLVVVSEAMVVLLQNFGAFAKAYATFKIAGQAGVWTKLGSAMTNITTSFTKAKGAAGLLSGAMAGAKTAFSAFLATAARLFVIAGVVWLIVEAFKFLTRGATDAQKAHKAYLDMANKGQREQLNIIKEELKHVDKLKASLKGMPEAWKTKKMRNQIKKLGEQSMKLNKQLKDTTAEIKKGIETDKAAATAKVKFAAAQTAMTQAMAATISKFLPLQTETKRYADQLELLDEAWFRGSLTLEDYNTAINNLAISHAKAMKSLQAVDTTQAQKDLVVLKDKVTELSETYKPYETSMAKLKKTEMELTKARKEGSITVDEYKNAIGGLRVEEAALNEERLASSTKFEDGWKRATDAYVDNARDAASNAESFFSKGMQGMEDSIINFTKTGKFEWKSFASDMIADLQRIQLRKAFAGMMGGSSGGGGGIFAGMFADGGHIPAGQVGIVGERGPEFISGPATITPMSDKALGGGSTNVTYNINAVDAMSFKQMVSRDPQFIYAVTEEGRRGLPYR